LLLSLPQRERLSSLSGLSAFWGARWAVRQHRSEQRFDRKLATYAAVFDAMNELSEEIDQLLDEKVNQPLVALTPAHRTTLARASANARLHLRKAARIGSFTISPEAEAILSQMLEQLNRAGDESFFQHLDTKGAAIDAAIAKLKEAARRDLNR
jgi:hypothetical protein